MKVHSTELAFIRQYWKLIWTKSKCVYVFDIPEKNFDLIPVAASSGSGSGSGSSSKNSKGLYLSFAVDSPPVDVVCRCCCCLLPEWGLVEMVGSASAISLNQKKKKKHTLIKKLF